MNEQEPRCCLCGGVLWGGAYNPAPLETAPGAVCCEKCHITAEYTKGAIGSLIQAVQAQCKDRKHVFWIQMSLEPIWNQQQMEKRRSDLLPKKKEQDHGEVEVMQRPF